MSDPSHDSAAGCIVDFSGEGFDELAAVLADLARRGGAFDPDALPGALAALVAPGFARSQAVLLHAYQRLAERCEALGDDASAADAWRRAAAQAPRGAYRTSLFDCADEAEQLSRPPSP